jgi:hypothetical protein
MVARWKDNIKVVPIQSLREDVDCSQVSRNSAQRPAFLSSTCQLGTSSPTALPPRARSNPFCLWPIHSVTLLRLFLRAGEGGGGASRTWKLKCVPESTYAVLYGCETWYLALRKWHELRNWGVWVDPTVLWHEERRFEVRFQAGVIMFLSAKVSTLYLPYWVWPGPPVPQG